MTERSRREHILQALADRREHSDRETYRVPLRRGLVLDVIELPLDVPVLNADSFRIAPQLEDHPQRDLVRRDPYSPEAQVIIAELVRSVHRNLDALKQNLLDEGQTQPGVITRSGKLINANTRCVLLRDLVREGNGHTKTISVAVLPEHVTNQEYLELEMMLQQQVDLKDKYRLISRLMMIKKLRDADLSYEAIAKNLRERKSNGRTGADKVKDLREVLSLMDRARKLPSVPLPITAFDSEVDQQQNWLELLYDVRRIEAERDHRAADDHIRGWLIAYFSGVSAVHNLRYATGDWLERGGVVTGLRQHDGLRKIVETKPTIEDESERPEEPQHSASQLTAETAGSTGESKSDVPSRGLTLLADDDEGDDDDQATSAIPYQPILDAVASARTAGDEAISLPDGTSVAAPDVREYMKRTVHNALKQQKRRKEAGDRLTRPANELRKALTALREVVDALEEVRFDQDFAPYQAEALTRASEVASQARLAVAMLEESGRPTHAANGNNA